MCLCATQVKRTVRGVGRVSIWISASFSAFCISMAVPATNLLSSILAKNFRFMATCFTDASEQVDIQC